MEPSVSSKLAVEPSDSEGTAGANMATTKEYDDYINSKKWRRIRAEALDVHGHFCSRCLSTKQLHVHHKKYTNFGDEQIEDLQVLCKDCHMKLHRIIKSRQKRSQTKSHTAAQTTIWVKVHREEAFEIFKATGWNGIEAKYGNTKKKKLKSSAIFRPLVRDYIDDIRQNGMKNR